MFSVFGRGTRIGEYDDELKAHVRSEFVSIPTLVTSNKGKKCDGGGGVLLSQSAGRGRRSDSCVVVGRWRRRQKSAWQSGNCRVSTRRRRPQPPQVGRGDEDDRPVSAYREEEAAAGERDASCLQSFLRYDFHGVKDDRQGAHREGPLSWAIFWGPPGFKRVRRTRQP